MTTTSLTAAQESIKHSLTVARVRLVTDARYTFFAVLALRMPWVFVTDASVVTAATNGTQILFNAANLAKLNYQQPHINTLLMHEVMHVALRHFLRGHSISQTIPRERINWAMDMVINIVLKDAGFDTSKLGVQPKTEYKHLSFEQILERMTIEEQEEADASTSDLIAMPAGAKGTDSDGNSIDVGSDAMPSEEELDNTMRAVMVQAIAAAQQKGTHIPNCASKLLDSFIQPKVDWRTQLSALVQPTIKRDVSFSRPCRRLGANGIIWASADRSAVGTVVLAVDTSGSTFDDALLKEFVDEMRGIVESINPQTVHVVYCDTAIRHIDVYEAPEPLAINMTGGGGTCFNPPFVYLRDNVEDAVLLVYLTDGYGTVDASLVPYCPVVWACTTEYTKGFAFGEVVFINRT